MLIGEEYAFRGKHLLASYYECDFETLTNIENLQEEFLGAIEASGATILSYIDHRFESDGLTLVVLLSESHASLHTYPEHRACFIDLFTCGDKCSAETFDKQLQAYLKPKHFTKELIERL